MKSSRIVSAVAAVALPLSAVFAEEAVVPVHKISPDGIGAAIGTITLKDSHHGLIVAPDLRDLPPGNHAFHIHENPNCGPGVKDGKKVVALLAGGHYDPAGKGHGMKHGEKQKHGGHGKAMHAKPHGDLPQLVAAADGTATDPVTTDKLKVAQIRGRAIMVHRYGEDDPGKPKGGGPRYACGVIPK